MNSTILLTVLFFCGLTLAQNNAAETEVITETQSCFPDMCKLLQEFGAMKENQKAMETRLKESENQILELKSKGIFAAPVPGVYYFTFFYHAGGSKPVSLVLMKNNQDVVTAFDHQTNHDGADNGGNAAFLQLQQGDQVYVRLVANTHVWGNNKMTTFSGVLLYTI
ncbi:complement C1q-like protein 4 [Melanotaenia boesemani]|uniref:complement C1q-like protein 4 n=1 Tax=Melanotaenia boesemani TaxID=1250792 RepID=UPI001C049AE4|nr:complement C1q-like protein 4 [Melanotaenia boesemani]